MPRIEVSESDQNIFVVVHDEEKRIYGFIYTDDRRGVSSGYIELRRIAELNETTVDDIKRRIRGGEKFDFEYGPLS